MKENLSKPSREVDSLSAIEAAKNLPKSSELASASDELNKAIVSILQEDGRMSYSDIASALSVSEGTVRNRVNWMKQSGVLHIVALTDPTGINYKADAMLGIKVAPGRTPREVGERLAEHPEVVYAMWVTGRYDLLVEIVCGSDEEFLEFVGKNCYSQEDIASVELMKGLSMIKNQFFLKRGFPDTSA
ncbi:MAG: Lrp/AsnC family transcriptional regulator [Methylophilaceae bacterium]